MDDSIKIIYEELCDSSSNKVKETLEILSKVCETQVKNKSRDFSIASIGRLSDDMGGIKAQGIRNKDKNKNNEKYRTLIQAYVTKYETSVTNIEKIRDPLHLAKSIEDPILRIMVLDLVSENIKLKNELNLQKRATTISLDLRTEQHQSSTPLLDNILNKQERDALSAFIQPASLTGLGLKIGTLGRLVNSSGKPVTQSFFIEAIEKLNLVIEE